MPATWSPVHPARAEPGPHAGAGERLAPPPTALVNNFTYGMGAGSSGVDLNAHPVERARPDRSTARRRRGPVRLGCDRRRGEPGAQGGRFTPFLIGDAGRYATDDYPDDGTTVNVNGGWGIPLGRGSLGLFGEFRDRRPTNRAWADPSRWPGPASPTPSTSIGQVVHKNNPVAQPNHHWGDGLEKDALALRELPACRSTKRGARDLQLRRLQPPGGHREPLPALLRQCPQLVRHLPARLPADDRRPGDRLLDGRRAARPGVGLELRSGAEFGHNDFDYEIGNTLNASLGPCLDVPCAPAPTAFWGRRTIPGFPTDVVLRRAGAARGVRTAILGQAGRAGAPEPVNLAFGARFGGNATRSAPGSWPPTSTAVPRTRPARRPGSGRIAVVSRLRPRATRPTGTAPISALRRRGDQPVHKVLAEAACGSRLQRLRLAGTARRSSASSRRAG